jgi:hypothetical protein
VASRTGDKAAGGADDRAVVAIMRTFFLAGLAGSALYLWHVHQAMGLRALVRSAEAVHLALSERRISSSHLFLHYFGVAATIVFAHRRLALRHAARWVDWALLAFFAMAMAISTERTQILWCLACAVLCWLLPPRGDRSLTRVITSGLVVVLAAGSFYLVVGTWLRKSPEQLSQALLIVATAQTQPVPADPRDEADQQAYEARARARFSRTAPMVQMRSIHVRPPRGWQAPEPVRQRLHALLPGGPFYRFSSLYISVAATLPALDQAVRAGERTDGTLIFHPIVRGLARLGIAWDTRSTIYEEALTPYPHNVYTYLYEPLLDFGWVGALVFAALLGLAAGWMYRRAAAAPESVWPLLLVQVQAMIAWSAFQNRVVVSNNWYLLALVVVAHSGGRLVERFATRSRGANVAGDRL